MPLQEFLKKIRDVIKSDGHLQFAMLLAKFLKKFRSSCLHWQQTYNLSKQLNVFSNAATPEGGSD